ncbi:hypothetical protein HPP92_000716 [Vanilla planifolia]|uniref:AAA+ ATPase domain-containing protein n=1 Tax=Vanilla planifolia TaxID=51239 RepID=A0A835RYM6_VANPL|nr:hypothetical protein HPP92_000716 [Vanilla planifolia]
MTTMVLSLNSSHTALPFYPSSLRCSIRLPHLVVLPALPTQRRRSSKRKGSLRFIRAISSGSGDGSGAFSWERVSGSFTRGIEMFWSNFMATLRKETGFDPDVAGKMIGRVIDVVNKGRGSVDWFGLEFVPSFVEWNRWENWKIQDGHLRKTMPKGLIPGNLPKGPEAHTSRIAPMLAKMHGCSLTGFTVELHLIFMQSFIMLVFVLNTEHATTWRDRLNMWKEIIRKDKLAEQIDSITSKYVLDFDIEEVEKSLHKDIVEKASNSQGTRALWISKRWWLYRPKLPYTYFLDKLDSSEVAAVVFTEDLKRVYVTMKEGFPLEYIVDIPLDPYMFEAISSSGCEVDLLQKWQIDYFLKVVLALAPALIILFLIRELVMLLHVTNQRYLYKKHNQLFDMAYSENFILSVRSTDIKAMHNEVILGGDVWDVLDEIMMYINNPMLYYEKEVPFVRGLLLSGPPGTGKTLFARMLAKESGLPFVFASGAEFVDSEKSGAARVNQLFSMAKRNAPSFVFVDEIDAIAGRHARSDPKRQDTFDALITQLDGEKETTGVDRFSLRQAVIFLCATNRPEDLDPELVRLGRIDRRVHIGLPDAKQRVRIFGVHSTGKRLAEDVDFGKVLPFKLHAGAKQGLQILD